MVYLVNSGIYHLKESNTQYTMYIAVQYIKY